MKKTLLPILLFITVFLTGYFAQRFTFSNQECLGLFLWTPDFLRECLSSSRPISHFIGSWLVQFYRFEFFGEAITALIVTLIYLEIRFILSRAGIKCDAAAVLGACICWSRIARSSGPDRGVSLLLIGAVVCLICLLIKNRTKWELKPLFSFIGGIAVLLGASFFIATDKEIRDTERWSIVEQAATNQAWDLLLETATPLQTETSRDMIPYALLALNEKGLLGEKMFLYPIKGPQDLDTEGLNTRRGFLFSSILYDRLGCTNEAVHQTFQAACYLRHGTSFRTLRRLVQFYEKIGNKDLVIKYCAILSRSTLHKKFISSHMNDSSQLRVPEEMPDSNQSYSAGIMNHDQQADLILLQKEGISSRLMLDRYFCYFLAKRDLVNFASQFEIARDLYQEIPRHFNEALIMLQGQPAANNAYAEYYASDGRQL